MVWKTFLFLFFCICWGVFYFRLRGQFQNKCDVVMRRMYILLFWAVSSVNVYQVHLIQYWVQVLNIFVNFLPCWSVWYWQWGVEVSPPVIVWKFMFLWRSLRTCFMNLGAPVLGACIFRIVRSSCWIWSCTIM